MLMQGRPSRIIEGLSLMRISLKIKSSASQGAWKDSILGNIKLGWGASRLTELPTGQLMMSFLGRRRCICVWYGVYGCIWQLAWLIHDLGICGGLWIIQNLVNCGLRWSPQVWDEVSCCLLLCLDVLHILVQVFHVFYVKSSVTVIVAYRSHAAPQKFISEDLVIPERRPCGVT